MSLGEINKTASDIESNTIVKIEFNNTGQIIKKLELSRVVGINKTSLKLSDGKTVSKGSLFPYYKRDFRREVEYFYLVDIVVKM